MNGVALLVGSTISLFGQQGATPLSLPDAIQLAYAHSNAVQIAQSSLDGAKSRLGQQSSRSVPHLGINGSATRFDDKTAVNLPGLGSFEVLPDHQEQLGVELAQDLDVAGQIGAGIAQARLLVLSAKYTVDAVKQDQALTTTTTFYSALRAKQAVAVASASLDAYREQLKTTTKLYEGGIGLKIDVDRSQSQVANAEEELTRRQNDLDSANSALNDQLGRSLDAPLVLVDSAPSAEPTSVESTDRPTLIAKALDHRSEALAATMQVKAAEKGIQIARGANGPSLSVALSGYHYPTTSFESPRENVGALTVTFSMPIFDGGLGREQVNEARSVVKTAKSQEDQTRREIALQVQNADLDVQTSRKRLEAARVALTSAEAARKLAQQRYESQVGLYLEVTDAQAALTAAQAAVVDATYDLLTAQARLARALSEPIAPSANASH